MIRVARGGLLTTVQDGGRHGMQQHGIVTAGAMDQAAYRIANLLVGNAAGVAALEATMVGPTLEFQTDTLVALTGADMGATLDDRTVPLWRPFTARAGSVLVLGSVRSGCRAYIAVAGGIAVPLVLGSRSTDLIASIGGLDGRALRPADMLPTGDPPDAANAIAGRLAASPGAARAAGRSLIPRYTQEPVIRVIAGPDHDRFSTRSHARFTGDAFEVTAQSNRMGIRLSGSALSLAGAYDLVSSPVATGTVQVPPSGEPIVLMSDHQTIGGYPRMAVAITVDLPLLAQTPPGARIRFREVTVPEAQSLYLQRERDFRLFAESVRFQYR